MQRTTVQIRGRDHDGLSASCSKLPVSFKLSFEDNLLTLQWDFKAAEAHESSSTRHLLLLNFKGLTADVQPMALLRTYYKSMPLGDFLRIVDLSGKRKSGWIEKTGYDVQFALAESTHSTAGLLRRIFSGLAGFTDRSTIVYFIGDCTQLSEGVSEALKKELKNHNYDNNFCLFQKTECLNEHCHDESLPVLLNVYEYYDQESLHRCLKQLMGVHASIRVRRLDIWLECPKQEIELRQLPGLKWSQHNPTTIHRRFNSLGNSCVYRDHVLLEASPQRALDFQAKMMVELCDWSKFEAKQTIKVMTGRSQAPEMMEMFKETKPRKPPQFSSERAVYGRSPPKECLARVVLRNPMGDK